MEPGKEGRGRRGDADADREGVDEEAHHGLDARELGGPARDGEAEEDILLGAVEREDESPGRLGEGVEGDLVLTREGVDGGRVLGGEAQLEGVLGGGLARECSGVGAVKPASVERQKASSEEGSRRCSQEM